MPHRLQDSFYRALFESPVAGIAVADLANLTIAATNNRMLEILGRTREEIEGIPRVWLDVTPPEYHALEEQTLAQFIAEGRSDPIEKEYLRPDGSRVPDGLECTIQAPLKAGPAA